MYENPPKATSIKWNNADLELKDGAGREIFEFKPEQATADTVPLAVTAEAGANVKYIVNNGTPVPPAVLNPSVTLKPNVENKIQIVVSLNAEPDAKTIYTIIVKGMTKQMMPFASWGRAKVVVTEKGKTDELDKTAFEALSGNTDITVKVSKVSDWVLPAKILVNGEEKATASAGATELSVNAKANDYIECVMQLQKKAEDMVKVIDATTTITGKTGEFLKTKPDSTNYDYAGVFGKDRNVSLSAYSLGKTELPYALWYEVYYWATKLAPASQKYTIGAATEGGVGTPGKDPDTTKKLPAAGISWNNAVVWCNAYNEMLDHNTDNVCYLKSETDTTPIRNVSEAGTSYFEKTKKGFRLPTEAEWEFAARYAKTAGDNTEAYGSVNLSKLWSVSGAKYPAPMNSLPATEYSEETYENTLIPETNTYASYKIYWKKSGGIGPANRTPTGITAIQEVETNTANAVGLYNMSGNVAELCYDINEKIATGDVTDPIRGNNSATGGTAHIVRGGAYNSFVWNLLTGLRLPATLLNQATYGLRLACYE